MRRTMRNEAVKRVQERTTGHTKEFVKLYGEIVLRIGEIMKRDA